MRIIVLKVFLSFSLAVLMACSDKREEQMIIEDGKELTFVHRSWEMNENENLDLRLVYRSSGRDYDKSNNLLNLKWRSENEKVVNVDQKGEVTAIGAGVVSVIAESVDNKILISTEVAVYNNLLSEKILQPLSDEIIYSKGVQLERNSVIQSFDIDSKGDIYYDQVGGNLAHKIFVLKGSPNQPFESLMEFWWHGHGTNIAVEEDGDDRYIWINSIGNKKSDGEYGSNIAFSRVKYEPNKIVKSFEEGDTYYLPGKANIHPAIDQENDILAVTTSGGGDPLRYFYIYKLSEAKALPLTYEELPKVKFGGEESDVPEQTVSYKLNIKNLNQLTPISSFSIGPADDKKELNSYDFQGFDIAEGRLYFHEGEANNNDVLSGVSNAFVTVFDYKTGRQISKRTRVTAIANINNLDEHGITSTGYMEAEGIKMKNGILYLGYASRSTDNIRRANVLMYK